VAIVFGIGLYNASASAEEPKAAGTGQVVLEPSHDLGSALGKIRAELAAQAAVSATIPTETKAEAPPSAPAALHFEPSDWFSMRELGLYKVKEGSAVSSGPFVDASITAHAALGSQPSIFILGGAEVEFEVIITPPGLDPSPEDADDPLLDVVAVGNSAQFHCTGIVVGPKAVLTAGHCLPATRVLFGSSVTTPILVSSVNLSVRAEPGIDIALLWIDGEATIPARAWHDTADGEPAALGKIAGFGATDHSATRGAGEKRAARIPLQGWGCDLSRVRTTGCVPSIELLAVAPGGVDTCDGDSGGPLLERVGNQWRLLGITSRPLASARKRCGEGGIYTRIDTITDWLRRNLASRQSRPTEALQ
jgi:hypothetical protein